ncbi:hypothetical protein ACFFX1_29940 [Dactylosporangium sucinum]|uniref:Uncharacterized protein n=1 Tax=Dactylosporangium sucinum TaxID=1424081 RepID=A0A917U9I6_9ACTN|nr:hypothetical protein [Dactylosporangium sucinum]GGM68863.1 hypothetical protein GCM10007977_083220 [Dactylosporangium sucinum]
MTPRLRSGAVAVALAVAAAATAGLVRPRPVVTAGRAVTTGLATASSRPELLVAVDAGYARARLALPEPLTTGAAAAALRAGMRAAADWPAFLKHTGGAARDRLDVTLTFTAPDEPVRVTRIRVRKAGTAAVFDGTEIAPSAAGAAAEPAAVTCDLDAPDAVVADATGADALATRNLELRAGERGTVVIAFTAKRAAYSWSLLVDWAGGAGTGGTVEITENGRLFALTGSASRYDASYVDNSPARGFSLSRRR